MLQVRDLFCERQRRVLFEHLSFDGKPGELIQIRGGNGTGKTTLLKILTGLYGDFEGSVDWDIEGWPLYIGHKPGVKDQLTVLENLRWLAAAERKAGNGADEEKLLNALQQVGLQGYDSVLCGSLSEGQRKRVNLARLLFSTAPVWVLDEPFAAIDVDGVSLIEDCLVRQQRAGGLVVLTSHQVLTLDGVRSVELQS